MEEKGIKISWDEILDDIKQIKAIKLRLNGKSYLLRTELGKNTYRIFQALGIKISPEVQLIDGKV